MEHWTTLLDALAQPEVRNSVLEGIYAGVPILAWPITADQFCNAKMVVEEIKIGLRVQIVDGRSQGFVTKDSLSSAVRELMESEKGKQLREKAKEAMNAMSEGGSSWNALNNFMNEI